MSDWVTVKKGRFVMDPDGGLVATEGERAPVIEWQTWPKGLRPVVQWSKGKPTVCHMADVERTRHDGETD